LIAHKTRDHFWGIHYHRENGLFRKIAVPPSTVSFLRDWMEKAVDHYKNVRVCR
jgi:hypothetical protein